MSDPQTLVDVFRRSTAEFADRPFLGARAKDGYQWTTYAEFGALVEACRGGLADLGVKPGDTVAIVADNGIPWAVAAHATWQLGATFCPLFVTQRPEEQVFILEDSGARVVIAATKRVVERIQEAAPGRSWDFVRLDGGIEDGGWERLLATGRKRPTPIHDPSPDDVADLIYTSGTTGTPKGVLLSHRNIVSNVKQLAVRRYIEPDDVSLSFLPWAHVMGQTVELHYIFFTGASSGLAQSVGRLLQNLQEVRPTVLVTVPRIFNLIHDNVVDRMSRANPIVRGLFDAAMKNAQGLREAREAGRSAPVREAMDRFYDRVVFRKVRDRFGGRLKYAVSGGAALAPQVARFVEDLHIIVMEGYGLTETSPLLTGMTRDNRRPGTAGTPLDGIEVDIRPVPELPPGIGEVVVRGPNVMLGYHNRPEETRAVLEPDGSFHTGDLGRFDDDGNLQIVGRVKEQYKLLNGKYVVPSQLEETLKLSPFIDQVMVEGANRPHNVAVVVVNRERLERWAEERHIPRHGRLEHPEVRALIAGEIRRHVGDAKAYERPKDFILVDDDWSVEEGILTPALKLKRRAVTDRYGERLERLYAGAEAAG